MHEQHRIWRRPKSSPDRDALHTIRIGFLIFMVLWFVLPALFP